MFYLPHESGHAITPVSLFYKDFYFGLKDMKNFNMYNNGNTLVAYSLSSPAVFSKFSSRSLHRLLYS